MGSITKCISKKFEAPKSDPNANLNSKSHLRNEKGVNGKRKEKEGIVLISPALY